MNINHNKSEKGQAIVYLVLGIVVFLGFVALAIDGGMVLSDRRHAQNAADAASLAGGAAAALHLKTNQSYVCDQQWSCPSSNDDASFGYAKARAKDRAGANDFSIDYDIADHNGVTISCGGNSWEDAFIKVTVDISATTPSNFLQLVYPTALHNEVEAVTYVDPGGPLEYGNAVVALNDASCSDSGSNGIIMGGSGQVNVSGGNIFSNGCLRDNGGVTVTVSGGEPMGTSLQTNNDNWDPAPILTDTQDTADAYSVDTPAVSGGICTDPAAHNIGQNLPSGTLSGLYCVTGSQGLSINNNESVVGTNVTIYLIEGPLTINGTPHLNISAPPTGTNAAPAIPGVLIYLPPSNHSPVIINGDSTSVLEGLILAPNSLIQLNGNGEVMYDGQVIGWDVVISGNADFKMVYNGCNGYLLPPSINLYK